MKTKIAMLMSAGFLLLCVGNAGAAQTLLPGASIDKFVDPLPVAGDISVIDATTPNGKNYKIHISEFQAQILPKAGVPGYLPANTASWVWGYLTDTDIPKKGNIPVRPSYLGPVVLAKRGLPA